MNRIKDNDKKLNEVNQKLENLANEKKTIEKKLEVYEIENEKKIDALESKLKIFGKAIEGKKML